MAKRALRLANVPRTYAELRDAVLAVVVQGRLQIDLAWVQSYHEIGRLIHEHLLFKQARAAYGTSTYAHLAEDSGISSRTLHECVKFFVYFPIVRRAAELNWNHYRVLCQVPAPARRTALLAQTIRLHWHSKRLEQEVRTRSLADTPIDIDPATRSPHQPLAPQRGTPGVYRVATVEGKRAVDLGFSTLFDLNDEQAEEFKDGALVRLDASGRITLAEGATKADLFNYRVELIRVVDGDTLWVRIYLRPRQWVKQKLRLRGLDCPELKTPEGKAAKRFVDALFAQTTAITINTTKPDKYDRYLADVFLEQKPMAESAEPRDDIYLNNTLLENGHAERKELWEFGDWEPDWIK